MFALRYCLSRNKFVSSSYLFQSTNVTVRNHSTRCGISQTTFSVKKSISKFTLPIRNVVSISTSQTTKIEKRIGRWLLLCAGMVGTAVSLGGYTRLTESGLSMVTWRLSFENAPKTLEEWMTEFKNYQQFPEFKQLKRNLTLEEFKSIWITEYVHRLWGRCIGIMFFVPASLFWLRGFFNSGMKKRILIFGSLLGAQGLLGWYMVKSGLEDRFHEPSDIPRVSQYRLASHLGLAFLLFTGLIWTGLEMLIPPRQIAQNHLQGIKKLKMLVHSCKGMIFLTALSGAFVAGLDAGLVYNSFPKMGDKWIPDDLFALSPLYKNIFENPTTVQFNHRLLGITTFSLALTTWYKSKRYPLPSQARLAANMLAMLACGQVILGITTLLRQVQLKEALSHQSGSMFMLTAAIWMAQELRKLKYVPK